MSHREALPPSLPWWKRITGRRALSWQVVVFGTLLTYPQIVLTGGTLGARSVQPEEFPTIAAVTAGAVVVAVSFAGIANVTFLRNRAVTPVPLWLYVTFYMTAGFIYATGMEISDAILGVDAVVPWPIRYLFAGVTTVGWGVLVSLILESQDRFRDERQRLIDQRVEVELTTLRESAEVERMRASLDADVRARLTGGRERLAEAVSASVDPESISALVRETAQDSVRALSHQLYEQAEQDNPRPRVAGVLRQSLSEPRFLPLATTALIAIGLPGAAIRAFGSLLAPVAIIVLAVAIYLLLRFSNLAIAAAHRIRHLIFIIGLGATVALVLGFALIPVDVPVPAAEAGSIVIGVSTAVIAAAFVAALSDVRTRVLRSLRDEVTRQHVEQEAYREELGLALRETARTLHGSVQTRLIACAAAIDQAAREEDSLALAAAMSEAMSVLDQHSPATPQPTSIASQVKSTCALWQQMCTIDVQISPDLASTTGSPELEQILEEALANAYRHGRASHIVVEITRQGDDVAIAVTDDGLGPGGGEPGLGTAMLQRLTHGRFTIEAMQPGTRVTAVLSGLGHPAVLP